MLYPTDFLDYWLNSIHTHVNQGKTETEGQMESLSESISDEPLLSPPVIIVCTKKDIAVGLHKVIQCLPKYKRLVTQCLRNDEAFCDYVRT